jgi:D-alanyl-D-alanine carboxypeptidase
MEAVRIGAGALLLATMLAGCSQGSTAPNTEAPLPTLAPSLGQNSFPSPMAAQLERVVATALQEYDIPGIAVWVSVPGKGIWTGAYGKANLATGQPLSLGAHLPIGSVTKTFTATVILQLVEEGRLSLSAHISQWLPQVQNSDKITVKMLLNMTSGIYDEGGPESQLLNEIDTEPNRVVTPGHIVDLAVAQGPAAPVGQFYYSNTNYIILGIIAQDITHQTIGDLITTEILRPLHLSQTIYLTTSVLPNPSAIGYFVGDGTPPQRYPMYNPSYIGAAGAMVSTVADMATWAKALATGQLLSQKTQAERLQLGSVFGSFSPLPISGQSDESLPLRYGLGLYSLGGFVGHNGGGEGVH